MLRFVNTHRLASVGLVAAAVIVLVAMVGGFGGNPSVADPAASSSGAGSTSAIATAPDSRAASTSSTRTDEPAPPPRGLVPQVRRDPSRGGAHQTALDYAASVQQQLLYLSADDARSLLVTWSASDDDDDLDENLAELEQLRSALLASGGPVWWSVSPIASKLDEFDDGRARVSVWVVRVVGSDVDPMRGGDSFAPTVDFSTTSVELVWDDDRGWSVWSALSTAGPVPMMSATSTMSSPSEFFDAVGSFTLVKEHS